jgi:hypothetical protein
MGEIGENQFIYQGCRAMSLTLSSLSIRMRNVPLSSDAEILVTGFPVTF